MKRLTYEGNFCEDIALCDPRNSTCGGNCRNREIWERLKAYEDTGLSPEDINNHLMGRDFIKGDSLLAGT